jgi:hypothetical protein
MFSGDVRLSQVQTGVAAMGQDCNYQFGFHEIGEKKGVTFLCLAGQIGVPSGLDTAHGLYFAPLVVETSQGWSMETGCT